MVGFIALDLLTPGKLGQHVMEGNPGAGLIAATGLVSLGLILYFAIYFTGAGWDGLDDAASSASSAWSCRRSASSSSTC